MVKLVKENEKPEDLLSGTITVNDRSIVFSGNVTEETAGILISTILKFNQDDAKSQETLVDYTPMPICIYINTNGGDLHSALAIVDIIETSLTPVFTFCLVGCFSAGFLMLLAGHKRFITENSYCMYHNLWHVAAGRLGQIEEIVDQDVELQDRIDKFVIKRCKITKKMLDEVRKQKKDFFMNAEECCKFKVVDYIVK